MFQAAQTRDEEHRADLMDQAVTMALRIERNRLKLGTALACAWSLSDRSLRPESTPIFS
ncbi:hypothetical protein [Novosphingobium sp. BL-52-GroH]|uniref:hypothetical protein n=1 Tax=Novosphingobium sp. BL-52-GroH TaxID=3349877 RepID=UPI00385081FE